MTILASGPERVPNESMATRAVVVLREHDFRFLLLASGAWYAARWMDQVTTGWLVLELTNSPLFLALVGASRHLPLLLLGILGGVLADRIPRRTLLALCIAALAGIALLLALLASLRALNGWLLIASTLAVNVLWAINFPSRRIYVAETIAAPDGSIAGLTSALALDQFVFMGTSVLFSAMAGALIPLVSPAGSYSVAGLVCLVGLPLALAIRRPGAARYRPAVQSPPATGYRSVLAMPVVVGVIAVSMAMNGLVLPVLQLLPLIARDVLGVGPTGLGLLMSAWGAGSLLGGMVLFAVHPRRTGWAFVAGSLGTCLAFIAFSFSDGYVVSVGLLFVAGVLDTFFGTLQSVLMIEAAGPAGRGRALGLMTVAIGVQPAGVLGVGALAGTFGAPIVLRITTAAAVVAIASAAIALRGLRAHDSRPAG